MVLELVLEKLLTIIFSLIFRNSVTSLDKLSASTSKTEIFTKNEKVIKVVKLTRLKNTLLLKKKRTLDVKLLIFFTNCKEKTYRLHTYVL